MLTDESYQQNQEDLDKLCFVFNSRRVRGLRPAQPIKACEEELPCGHTCGGCKDESNHLTCLEPACRSANQTTCEDNCIVCYQKLSNGPAIEIGCGHLFHVGCIQNLLRNRWSTMRITFNFLKCPSCTHEIDGIQHVRQLHYEQIPMRMLKKSLGEHALKRINQDSMMNEQRIDCPLDDFYKQPVAYALYRSEYYECKSCHCAFFGGYIDCAMERGFDSPQAAALQESDLKCRGCTLSEKGIKQQFMCKRHGLDHIQFKCDLCCNLAQYHGRANSYLCQECYDYPQRITKFNCGGSRSKCPLDTEHLVGMRGVPVAGCCVCRSSEDRGRITNKSDEELKLEAVLAEVQRQAKGIIVEKANAQRMIQSAKRSREFAAHIASAESQSSTDEDSMSSSNSTKVCSRRVF